MSATDSRTKIVTVALAISIVTVAMAMIVFNKEYIWERFVSRKSFLYANATPPLSSFMTVENVENLKIGQKRLTEMLRVFDEICMKNGVEYFVIGGTLLGAFAYEGWIPWDGDIDVEILKSHWPKLEKLLMSDLPDTMWLQTEKTDKHYRSWLPNFVMGKVRDLNSCYHRCQDGTRFHNGFMVDLNLYYFEGNRLVMPDNKNVTYMTSDDIYPLIRLKFDGITVNAPRNPEKYLQRNYNSNFRELLPIKMRYPHEGILDPHKTCPHHFKLYPGIYAKGSNSIHNK